MDPRIEKIICHYGFRHQLGKAREELYELIEVIEKVQKAMADGDLTEKGLNHMAEEIADVRIMVDQLELAMGKEKQCEAIREFKLDRQMQRIARGE